MVVSLYVIYGGRSYEMNGGGGGSVMVVKV